jgi:oleate hydratase
MRNYDRINALPPEGIEDKRAHIIGGGLAGLAAAAFLATDAHMPAGSVTVYETLPLVGGAMDAAGDARGGYTSRGERELEARMECLWYLCSKVPSLRTPGLTILDETHRANIREPIYSRFRLMEKQGQLRDSSGALMSPHDAEMMMRLVFTPEEELEGLAVTDWFSPEFTTSTFWYCWSTMLAFREYHSLIEVKRYLARFLMYSADITHLAGILHTEYNEFDSIIKPLLVWLQKLGVRFRTDTTVIDMDLADTTGETVVTGLTVRDSDGSRHVELTRYDLVFFTSGSLTQNATMGDTGTVATIDRDTTDRGCFTVWEKLAARDPKFGNPAAFISDIDKSNWMSFFPTITGDSTFFDYMEAKTRNVAGTGGAVTIVDSSWKISFVLYSKYFPDQPDDVNVFWGYGQCSDVPGDYIKKPMQDCTGAEVLAEVLYHCGLEDEIDDILEHASVSTSMMPYITSQFMPRKVSDRPKVIPDGCVNLAFMGQFVELPGDCVFTVETSVRTAMMGVWGLTGLDKPMVPLYEPIYDVRVLVSTIKRAVGIQELLRETLPSLAATVSSPEQLAEVLNSVPAPQI